MPKARPYYLAKGIRGNRSGWWVMDERSGEGVAFFEEWKQAHKLCRDLNTDA